MEISMTQKKRSSKYKVLSTLSLSPLFYFFRPKYSIIDRLRDRRIP